MNIKIIVGYRRDQEHSIPAEEAHKAYYLFLHPEQRGVFSTGLAIKGDQIQEIVPDWHGTMGWNPTHTLDSDDWNDIRVCRLDRHLCAAMTAAKEAAQIATPQELNLPLSQVLAKYPQLAQGGGRRQGGMTSVGSLLAKPDQHI
jgi:hypothetical protein